MIAPYAEGRAQVRKQHQAAGIPFLEIYVATPIEICAQRDVKGLYARQAAGEISGLTGVDDPYEPPTTPELRVDTQHEPVKTSADTVYQLLVDHSLVQPTQTATVGKCVS